MAVFLPVTAVSVFNFAPLPMAIPNCERPASAALPTAIVCVDVLLASLPIAIACGPEANALPTATDEEPEDSA